MVRQSNKPNGNFRTSLQERLDKTNPSGKLAKDETTKLTKLEGIVQNLRRGGNVQNRQLQTWLSEDEYAQVDIEWDTQKHFREELKDKPSELKRYEDKLKEAIMMRNRSDAYHRKGKKSVAYKLDSKCESLCEDALEILHVIVTADPSLQLWFDRELAFAHGSLIDANLSSLPQLITSRSHEKLSDDNRLTSKQSFKLAVVERAMYGTGRDTEVSRKGDSLMLEKFLSTDD